MQLTRKDIFDPSKNGVGEVHPANVANLAGMLVPQAFPNANVMLTNADMVLKTSLLSDQQIQALLDKYPDDLQLWSEFWKWYERKGEVDLVPTEQLFATADALEAAWTRRKNERTG